MDEDLEMVNCCDVPCSYDDFCTAAENAGGSCADCADDCPCVAEND